MQQQGGPARSESLLPELIQDAGLASDDLSFIEEVRLVVETRLDDEDFGVDALDLHRPL